ncbi:unnamed protein product (macronuclear) [Paramecium tetraurelia]|uniref:Uncharacterized protein n=1 Tax=Paramecium tetraurelia TaxID=5888 RepID=A0CJ18_PARTE|nr:uncharacterized protein GSPATT00007920001 [Paramecium tetraurelia]CAK70785.1 unnamed protein product [Paramecium tetraurelia]|eukprot:XP_001438182.1 hypothetical protein (macronuclear) [Paramecium tetraurelia strain d4-2]
MTNMRFSLDASFHSYQFCDIEINDRTQNLPHFEPIHILSQQNKFNNLKKEIKLSPLINYDNNNTSLMYYQIKVQKMRVKKAIQSRSSKYRRIPDLDYNSNLRIIQPSSKTMKITQRISSQPQRLPTKSFCDFKDGKVYQQKVQTKIKTRLPSIEKHQIETLSKSSLNCWTRQTTSSLFQEN